MRGGRESGPNTKIVGKACQDYDNSVYMLSYVAWYVSKNEPRTRTEFLLDLINLVAIIVVGVQHNRTGDTFELGQSYWFTVCSTAASTFTNLTLIYDMWATPDFASSGKNLVSIQMSTPNYFSL